MIPIHYAILCIKFIVNQITFGLRFDLKFGQTFFDFFQTCIDFWQLAHIVTTLFYTFIYCIKLYNTVFNLTLKKE